MKLEKHNNYKGFLDFDVFMIQKKFINSIYNGEITYQMIYKKEEYSEKELQVKIKVNKNLLKISQKEKIIFDVKLACILYYVENFKKKINCINLNEAEVFINEVNLFYNNQLNYLRCGNNNSDEEYKRIINNSQLAMYQKYKSKETTKLM